MSVKLFVGNLSFDVTEQDLEQTFAVHGSVLEVQAIYDRDTGRPRGFAFVTMETREEADAAIAALTGVKHQGRDLTVNEARSREERPQGPRGNNRDRNDNRGGRGRRQSNRY